MELNETELGLGIGHEEGFVRVNVTEVQDSALVTVAAIRYTPEQAVEVATLLIKHAKDA